MKLRTIAFATVFAMGCATTLPTRAPLNVSPITAGENEVRVIDRIVVLTDASGTQYANATFPTAKALTQSFVSAMPERNVPGKNSDSYTAGSIGFGGDDRITSNLQPFNRQGLSSSANSLVVLGSIDGTGGHTPFHNVLKEAQASLANGSGRAALVVFSDGLPDDPARAMAVAKNLVNAIPEGVCIHTVQTGSDATGRQFLSDLSNLTDCGSIRNAESLTSGAMVASLSRQVFLGSAGLPAVGARGTDPCQGVVRLRGVEFAFDRAEITSGSAVVLDVAVEHLRSCPSVAIEVQGHTDWIGPDSYNESLSARRAAAVKQYFVSKGISSGRLTARGFGESKPIAPNDSPDGRAQNRRVELR